MSNLIVREHNLETNEIVDREMTQEELDLHSASIEANRQALEDKATAKAELLSKLGITEEEAKLLLS